MTSKIVLVVDDAPINRLLLTSIFTKLGWTTFNASHGQEALDWLNEHPQIDLIFLDISMPGMDGEEVCRILRQNPMFYNIPIIAYTAHAFSLDINRFLHNGFNDVLIKPISLGQLTDIVSKWCPN